MNTYYLQELVGETFDAQDLSSIGITSVQFKRCTFVGADLRHATFDQCRFTSCDFRQANLRAASLRFTLIRGCDLRDADLRDCDLTGATIGHRAALSGRPTDLTGCRLDGAKLTDVTFLNVIGLPVSLGQQPTQDGGHRR